MTGMAYQVMAIVNKIKPLLANQPPELQSAVIAELLALWLAGHHVKGDTETTGRLRAELLGQHCDLVRQLTTANAHLMGTTP